MKQVNQESTINKAEAPLDSYRLEINLGVVQKLHELLIKLRHASGAIDQHTDLFQRLWLDFTSDIHSIIHKDDIIAHQLYNQNCVTSKVRKWLLASSKR